MRLPFELDPQIIHHIIYSQAGSIGKAVIELIMNSVDANAKIVKLSITCEGLRCEDDGTGFISKEDVLRYFGRFGTPHEEGDATYGRFRLGRGQIMAHASTVWESIDWRMTVDTRSMGYNYDLDTLVTHVPGCVILGTWYESLSQTEFMSTLQEIRDLVRYTPVTVELNGQIITRDPRNEKWDFEDEYAYYRVKAEGSVSIYNQGVLVRHDSGHQWGCGGLIVSKKPIALNVSRTEILRKTCPVWKEIAKQFKILADEISIKLGDRRKTEVRREKNARALLSGDSNFLDIFDKEEVITILPGKQHVTMDNFFWKTRRGHHLEGTVYTVVMDDFDIPKAEIIAKDAMLAIVHSQTLYRFGCYSPEEFHEVLLRILSNRKETLESSGSWSSDIEVPTLIAYEPIRDTFITRTQIVSEKELDKETRRAWTALRWVLLHYVGLCTGKRMYRNGKIARDEEYMHILIGRSNTAEAWTDGRSYIAFDLSVVKRIKSEPLKTVTYIFSLMEHEIAHEGDSLDCGHDEAFYQRYHDLSIKMAPDRQRYMHMWLMKYTMSLEQKWNGKKERNRAWWEKRLLDRAGDGREKHELPGMIEDVSNDPVMTFEALIEDVGMIDQINFDLAASGQCPPPPDWKTVFENAKKEQIKRLANYIETVNNTMDDEDENLNERIQEENELMWNEEIDYVLHVLQVDSITSEQAMWLTFEDEERIRRLWEEKPWEAGLNPDSKRKIIEPIEKHDEQSKQQKESTVPDYLKYVDSSLHKFIHEGETEWMLERNTAAAGFSWIGDYLRWRSEQ